MSDLEDDKTLIAETTQARDRIYAKIEELHALLETNLKLKAEIERLLTEKIERLQFDLAACDEAGKRVGAALTSAAILINALLDELIHSSRAADRPLPLQLIAAKGSFDLQMQRLLKTLEPKAEEEPKP